MAQNRLTQKRPLDAYGWAIVCILMTLFILADLLNLDALQPILIVPAIILFAVLVVPFLFRGRP